MLLVRDEIGTDYDQDMDTANGERRRGLRVRQSRPIKVLDLCAGKIFGGQTRDISATGLQIELPAHAPVCVGDLLSVHVGIGTGGLSLANRRSVLPVKIVWIDRSNTDEQTLTAGVEYATTIGAQRHAA